MSDYYAELSDAADRQRRLEQQQAAAEAQARRDEQQAAAEQADLVRKGNAAHALLQDENLWELMMTIRNRAVDLAIAGPDAPTREAARLETLAVDRVYTEMRDRLQTALSINESLLNAKRYE